MLDIDKWQAALFSYHLQFAWSRTGTDTWRPLGWYFVVLGKPLNFVPRIAPLPHRRHPLALWRSSPRSLSPRCRVAVCSACAGLGSFTCPAIARWRLPFGVRRITRGGARISSSFVARNSTCWQLPSPMSHRLPCSFGRKTCAHARSSSSP